MCCSMREASNELELICVRNSSAPSRHAPRNTTATTICTSGVDRDLVHAQNAANPRFADPLALRFDTTCS